MHALTGVLLGLPLAASAALGAPDIQASPLPSVEPTCEASLAAGRNTIDLLVEGEPREVIMHVPSVATGIRPPAVVAFHGYTAHARQLEETSGLSSLADEQGFVVAYPEASGQPTEWHFSGNRGTDSRDLELTDALLTALVEQACVDPGRIVLAGHSMGGGMANDAACRLASRVAGVVLVSALWLEAPCHPSRPLPVVAVHALDDAVLPYGGGPLPAAGLAGPSYWGSRRLSAHGPCVTAAVHQPWSSRQPMVRPC